MPHESPQGRTDSAGRLILASADETYAAFSDGETLMKWMPPPNMTGRDDHLKGMVASLENLARLVEGSP